MKREGNKTTFTWARHGSCTEAIASGERVLVMVEFDGEMDVWNVPADEAEKGVGEIELYYRADWAGTDRTLAMLVFPKPESRTIDCR